MMMKDIAAEAKQPKVLEVEIYLHPACFTFSDIVIVTQVHNWVETYDVDARHIKSILLFEFKKDGRRGRDLSLIIECSFNITTEAIVSGREWILNLSSMNSSFNCTQAENQNVLNNGFMSNR